MSKLKTEELYSKGDMGKTFEEHLKLHGQYNTTLERINNNSGYKKSNCKWATRLEQARNTSRSKNTRMSAEYY